MRASPHSNDKYENYSVIGQGALQMCLGLFVLLKKLKLLLLDSCYPKKHFHQTFVGQSQVMLTPQCDSTKP